LDLDNFDCNEFKIIPLLARAVLRSDATTLINKKKYNKDERIIKNTIEAAGESVPVYKDISPLQYGEFSYVFANLLNGYFLREDYMIMESWRYSEWSEQ